MSGVIVDVPSGDLEISAFDDQHAAGTFHASGTYVDPKDQTTKNVSVRGSFDLRCHGSAVCKK